MILDEVKAAGGITYATEKMINYRDRAIDILNECPQNEYTNGLKQLVKFTTDRRY